MHSTAPTRKSFLSVFKISSLSVLSDAYILSARSARLPTATGFPAENVQLSDVAASFPNHLSSYLRPSIGIGSATHRNRASQSPVPLVSTELPSSSGSMLNEL